MLTIQEIIDLLSVKKIGDNIFVGENHKTSWGRVFGGQVLGQSLHAAYQTVPKGIYAHSMHAYFILGGQIDIPIVYEVDLIRDGRSFTTRRVVAKQNDVPIFNMSVSFHKTEEGINHQIEMPIFPKPEGLSSTTEQIKEIKDSAPELYDRFKSLLPKAFEMRPIENILNKYSENSSPTNDVWFKASSVIEQDNLAIHHQLLAYASDYNLINTATFPYRKELSQKKVFYASLDHAIWFHRSFRIDNWLMYSMNSPSASNSRGFNQGRLFNEKGDLIASVIQEGLIREQKL